MEEKQTLPLWMHWTGRIVLQLVLGFLTYRSFKEGSIILTLLFSFAFIYCIAILFIGEKLRNWVLMNQ